MNNAGITRVSCIKDEDEDVDLWWRVQELNVRAPVAMVSSENVNRQSAFHGPCSMFVVTFKVENLLILAGH